MSENREKILECLNAMEKLSTGDDGSLEAIKDLRKEVRETKNEHHLFLMLQTLREVIAKETKDSTEFKVKMPDGEVKKFNTIEEAHKGINGYKTSEVNYNKPVHTTSGRKFRNKEH